jgi:hypothetical protein
MTHTLPLLHDKYSCCQCCEACCQACQTCHPDLESLVAPEPQPDPLDGFTPNLQR